MHRNLTRGRHDHCNIKEYNDVTTGPGRYALEVPDSYRDACFAPEPTIRMQKWGASHDMNSTKTDVESDLLNLSRPTTRTTCGQWDPNTAPQRTLTAMSECSFPQTFGRLVDPPCTLRGTGWNRFEWLCQNPQENVMVPFEWMVDSRMAEKDNYKPLFTSPATEAKYHEHVPVPRMPGPHDVKDFTNQIPGASMKQGTPPMVETPRGVSLVGSNISNNVPIGPASVPSERIRALSGVYNPPTPFSTV